MPNWCENDLTVEGPTEVIEEFLKFAAGESPFDFDRFIPYPEEFRRLDEAAEAWDREHAGRPDYDWWRGRKMASTRAAMTGVSRIGARSGPPSASSEAGVPLPREDGGGGVPLRYGMEPALAGHREGGKALSGVTVRTPLFRVRLLFQRAFSLQRWRGRDRRVRPVFRRAGRISRSLSRTTAFHASRPPWNGPSSRVKSGGRARPVFRGRGIQSGLP